MRIPTAPFDKSASTLMIIHRVETGGRTCPAIIQMDQVEAESRSFTGLQRPSSCWASRPSLTRTSPPPIGARMLQAKASGGHTCREERVCVTTTVFEGNLSINPVERHHGLTSLARIGHRDRAIKFEAIILAGDTLHHLPGRSDLVK